LIPEITGKSLKILRKAQDKDWMLAGQTKYCLAKVKYAFCLNDAIPDKINNIP
jgi:hypothetical protein